MKHLKRNGLLTTFTTFITLITVLALLAVSCGNEEAITNAVNDETPPEVELTAPVDGDTISSDFTIEASALDPESGVAKVEFYFNGSKISADSSSPYASKEVKLAGIDDGDYTLKVVAVNAKGLSASNEISITIDTSGNPVAPEISISSPANGDTMTTTSFTVDVTVEAGSVESVAFYTNGTLAGTDTASEWSLSIDATSLDNQANNTIQVVGTDANGLSDTNQILVYINTGSGEADVTAPTLTITSPADGATLSSDFTIGADASDSGSGMQEVEFYIDGTPINTDTSYPYQSSLIDVDTYGDGSYALQVLAYDVSNNMASNMVSITIATQTNEVVTEVTMPDLVPIGEDYSAFSAPVTNVEVSNPVLHWSAADVTGIQSYVISVWDEDQENVYWWVSDIDASVNQVTYGTVPAGATQLTPAPGEEASPLPDGARYVFNVVATDSADSMSGNQIGISHLNVDVDLANKSMTRANTVVKTISREEYEQMLRDLRNQ